MMNTGNSTVRRGDSRCWITNYAMSTVEEKADGSTKVRDRWPTTWKSSAAVVERHGAWEEDIEAFGRVVQKALFEWGPKERMRYQKRWCRVQTTRSWTPSFIEDQRVMGLEKLTRPLYRIYLQEADPIKRGELVLQILERVIVWHDTELRHGLWKSTFVDGISEFDPSVEEEIQADETEASVQEKTTQSSPEWHGRTNQLPRAA